MPRQTRLGDQIRALLEAPCQVNDVDRFMSALNRCIAKVIRVVYDGSDPRIRHLDAPALKFAADCEMHEIAASDLNGDMLSAAADDVLRGLVDGEDLRGEFYDRVRDRLADTPANDTDGKPKS